MAYTIYVGEHSGQEIDTAVDRALNYDVDPVQANLDRFVSSHGVFRAIAESSGIVDFGTVNPGDLPVTVLKSPGAIEESDEYVHGMCVGLSFGDPSAAVGRWTIAVDTHHVTIDGKLISATPIKAFLVFGEEITTVTP